MKMIYYHYMNKKEVNILIFNQILFEPVSTEKLFKSQMNGMDDKTIPDFNPVTFSSAFKPETQSAEAQKEFIHSYLESAKALAIKLDELERPRGGIQKIFYNYSLTLPIIYLCRHCLELSIKYAISCINGKPKEVHGLDKVWSSFRSYLPTQNSGKERSVLKEMGNFVQAINLLDDTGTKLRYPLNKDGTCTQGKFLWANSKQIVSSTEKFVKQLEELNIDNIKSANQSSSKS